MMKTSRYVALWKAMAPTLAVAALAGCAPGTMGTACAQAASEAAAVGALDPQVHREGSIAYVNGGIGAQSQARTRELGHGMSLHLVFAEAPSGAYLADAQVTITDGDGKVLLGLAKADPLLFVDLPPGRYRVSATSNGRTITRSVQVPAKGQRLEYFHWRASQDQRL